MAFRVFIDPGHGGTDPGAVHNGRQEKDDVLKLALAVGRILEDNGIDVVYSRTEDFYDSPYEKAMKGNESEADLFLSIHRNAAALPGSGSGADMLVYADTGFASDVANRIGDAIADIGFQFNGITERPNLAVLRRTKMPAVLVEAGFIDNENDNLFFDENFDALAEAIAQGVLSTFDQYTGFDTLSATEERTDHPENMAMNADSRSAFTDIDPARLMQNHEEQIPASVNDTAGAVDKNDTAVTGSTDKVSQKAGVLSRQNIADSPGNIIRNENDRCGNCNNGRNNDDWRDRDDRRDRDFPCDRDDWRCRNRWRDRDRWRGGWFDILDASAQPGNPAQTGNSAQSGNSMQGANSAQPGSPGRPSGPESPGRPDRPGRPGSTEKRLYRVQVGAFTNPMFATQLLNQLLLEGFPAFVIFSDGLYRVQVGAFSMLENAVRMERRLRSQGYQTYITT